MPDFSPVFILLCELLWQSKATADSGNLEQHPKHLLLCYAYLLVVQTGNSRECKLPLAPETHKWRSLYCSMWQHSNIHLN
jgi:hypothetical protein